MEERRRNILGTSGTLNSFLCTSNPVCLPARLRWAVAAETLHSKSGCQGCNSLSEMCVRHYSSYEMVKNLNHVSEQRIPKGIQATKSWGILQLIVHGIVNHEARLDKKWYKSTIEEIASSNELIPEEFVGKTRRILAVTLFLEVLAVVAAYNMVYVSHLLLDAEFTGLPELESVNEMTPTHNDMQSNGMIHKGEKLAKGEKVPVPHITPEILNTESPAFRKLPSNLQTYMQGPIYSGYYQSLSIVPASSYMVMEVAAGISLPPMELIKAKGKMQPSLHCTKSFTRRDLYLSMAAVASANKSDF